MEVTMNIIVCIKQVPDTTEVKINPETNTLMRAGVPSIVNPFDEYALETALQLKDKVGGKVTVITMGPPQAKDALKQCYAMGADEMILISDKYFGGSDTLATSYTLSSAIKKIGGYDLIICGKQATDGDTAQVGPEIAEHLDIPQVTYGVDIEFVDGKVRVNRENDNVYEIVEASLPALVTITKTNTEPRNPNIKRRLAANRAEVPVLTAADIEFIEMDRLGLKGSPTKVKKIFAPQTRGTGIKIEGYTSDESVKILFNYLLDSGL
jgi:electron transfer flavoprotein beta subunit